MPREDGITPPETPTALPPTRVEGKGGRLRLRLRIETMAAGGEGVGHVLLSGERRAVFVSRTAPGDVVETEVDFAQRPARGELLGIVEASATRTDPPCPIWNGCGGCDWMHLSQAAELEAHANRVRSALEKSNIRHPPLQTHAAPKTERYRTRARLCVQAEGQRARFGYRRKASHDLQPVRSCLVLDERLEASLERIANLFQKERGHGEIAIAVGKDDRPVLDVTWAGSLSGRFFRCLEEGWAGQNWAGAAVRIEGARRPAVVGDPRVVTVGADGEPLLTPSAGFAQANPWMSVELARRALLLLPAEGSQVLELFSGSGNLSVALARTARSLTTVEFAAPAVECARTNLRQRHLSAHVVEADALTFPVPHGTTMVWLDPPRSGARTAALAMVESRVRRIAYISCDPSTLARDLAILTQGGFEVTALEIFEMFPHTSHIEVLATLDRPKGRRGALPPTELRSNRSRNR